MRKALGRLLFETPDWAWLALALALRLAFAFKAGDRFLQMDEGSFDSLAWSLASTGAMSSQGQPAVGPPVVNGFFALCYGLLGHRLFYARAAQAVVSAAFAVMVGRMTQSLSGSRLAGRLALVLAAVYPFFIYYSGVLLSETLYLCAATAGLWWLCRSLRDRGTSLRRAGAAGLALAAAALCRPEAAPIAVLLWAAGALACWLGRWSWRAWAVAVLLWALPLGLWCERNRAAVGAFALDFHGGITMLHGSLLFDENEVDTSLAMAALEKTPFYQETLSLPAPQRDRAYLRRSLAFMRENPGRVAGQWARKLVSFWRFYPRTDKTYRQDERSDPGVGLSRAVLVAASLVFEPALILAGLWGLWVLWRGRPELFPLAVFLLGTMLIHMVSVSQMRYRLPIMPLLILGACARLAAWLEPRASGAR